MEKTEYRMNDQTIAQIAKILQVAILTGTDIVDNLRQARFVLDGESLNVSPKYASEFNENLEAMINAAKTNYGTNNENEADLTADTLET